MKKKNTAKKIVSSSKSASRPAKRQNLIQKKISISKTRKTAVGAKVKKSSIVIPVTAGDHEPSPYVVSSAEEVSFSAPVEESKEKLLKQEQKKEKYLFWINQLSFFSLLFLVFLFVKNLAFWIFRIPASGEIIRGRESLLPWRAYGGGFSRKIKTLNHQWKNLPSRVVLRAVSGFRVMSPIRGSRLSLSLFMPKLAGFALMGVLVVSPIWIAGTVTAAQATKDDLTGEMREAFGSITSVAKYVEANNFYAVAGSFNEALVALGEIDNTIRKFPAYLKVLSRVTKEGQALQSAEHLLTAVQALARAGQKVATGLAVLNSSDKSQAQSPGEIIIDLGKYIEVALPELETVNLELSKVNPSYLPTGYSNFFRELQNNLLPSVVNLTQQLKTLTYLVPDLLGNNEPKRYLLMFQNDYELRASGGFLGSFALIDVKNGEIINLEIPGGGTYDLQGSLTERILAPKPLQLINTRWEFQDANWWVDWPTSARKIQWFYERSGGSSVDGVIAIDTELMESLLKLTGPIEVPNYDVVIEANNFVLETLFEVEKRYDRSVNKPKQFLADLAPLLISRLSAVAESRGVEIINLLETALSEKHLLLYSTDDDIQLALETLGWASSLKATVVGEDNLSVVHTNIAGQKTDGVIEDEVVHEANLQSDNSIIVDLTITRTHKGKKGDLFTGVRNVDYLRVYVPAGSVLIDASGFSAPDESLFAMPESDLVPDKDLVKIYAQERVDPKTGMRIYQEFGRSVFANWLMTDPGESTTVKLRYRLPWRLQNINEDASKPWVAYFGNLETPYQYALQWNKQPGLTYTNFRHEFKSGLPFQVLSSTQELIASEDTWIWQEALRRDKLLKVIFLQ